MLRPIEQKIAGSFFRTNAMSWKQAQELAGLAVTIYENEHRKQRICETNPATRIQIEQWSRS